MLKLLGTIGAVAAAAVLFDKTKAKRETPATELETVASVELRKILLYAAPPTFLARVASLDDEGTTPLRWMGKAAGH